MRATLLACLALLGTGCLRGAETDDLALGDTEVETPALRSVVTTEPLWRVHTEAVRLEGEGGPIAGTLLLPDSPVAAPGVLLLGDGLGKDRNWEGPQLKGRNGSGRLLADALARHGMAVLRVDPPGTGDTPARDSLGFEDLLAVHQIALEGLAGHERVDGTHLFVLGHGEGGLAALRLAEDPRVAGVGLLATPGRPLVDRLGAQLEAAGRGEVRPAVESALADLIAGREVVSEEVSSDTDLQALFDGLQDPATVAYHRELLALDPVTLFPAETTPVLLLHPGRSLHVDRGEAERLARAGGERLTRVDVSHADHALKVEERPRRALEPDVALSYNAPGRALHPEVPAAIVRWVEARTRNVPIDAFYEEEDEGPTAALP